MNYLKERRIKMKFWRIKWENIFGIITGSILVGMTIKYVIQNGFDFNVIMFDLVYVSLSILAIMWCVKMTRKFYLED